MRQVPDNGLLLSSLQTDAWPTHKLECRAPLPSTSRIWIIHPKGYAPAHSDEPLASREAVEAHLQAWDMKEGIFGNESKEKEAIKKKFKWTGVDEGGKAYNKAGRPSNGTISIPPPPNALPPLPPPPNPPIPSHPCSPTEEPFDESPSCSSSLDLETWEMDRWILKSW